ncbi:hypothetical protein HX889_41885 [Pseudomonas reactans]|nr:hypothetical protein [Pseudomonas reactans]
MNLSSNCQFLVKMTVMAVIFFYFLSACSFADKLNDNFITENKSLDNSFMSNNVSLFLNTSQNSLKTCTNAYEEFKPSLLKKETYDGKLNNHYVVESPYKGEIYNVVNIPESGPEWVSIIVSLGALIFSVGIPIWQHKRGRKESINEGFWLREVIMPKVNNIAFDVCSTFKNSLLLSPADFASNYQSSLLPKIGELRDSFYLFECYPNFEMDIDDLQTICDEFENNVDNNQDSAIDLRQKDISDFHIKFISKLIQIHKKIG